MPKIEVIDDEEVVQSGIQGVKASSRPKLPDELAYIVTAFIPSQPASLRTKAYVELTAFCKDTRANSPQGSNQINPAILNLTQTFEPLIRDRLSETTEGAQTEGFSLFTALFQIDWEIAAAVFTADGVYELVVDCVELLTSPSVALPIAQLLSQACGHKQCRAVLTDTVIEWLGAKSRGTSDPSLAGAAAVALIKQIKGAREDNKVSFAEANDGRDEALASVMKGIILAQETSLGIGDAIEGLAYLSASPTIKEMLSKDDAFLKRLLGLIPRKTGHEKFEQVESPDFSLIFGILAIVVNLCTYRPQMSEEDRQLEKLKRMAQATSKRPPEIAAADKDDAVKRRIERLISAGLLGAVSSAAVSLNSTGLRTCIAQVLINIIRDRDNRGKVLQSGGSKTLLSIISHELSSAGQDKSMDQKQSFPQALLLETIQALARLAITSSPLQVFGPNVGIMYDAILPFSVLLQHNSSNMLQKFEAMMAFTNLASHSAELATRIAQADGLLDRVELLLFEDHELVRRAAMELTCNLILGSDPVFARYGGEEVTNATKSKLHVLLAMSDVDDLPTRLAASGALATLAMSPSACRILTELQVEKKNAVPILVSLVEAGVKSSTNAADRAQQLGLTHRGIVCLRFLCVQSENTESRKLITQAAKNAGLLQHLAIIVRGQVSGLGADVVGLATEVLKALMDSV
ncbi:hypothetical protein AX16_000530 [Volvariella volvacea WC 439]|nr:hypothetical protein AX16_000530 [Volvariella volvacea WC 439]